MGDSCAQGGKPGIKETGTPEDVPRTAAITHAAGIKKAPADVMGALLRLELHGFPHPVAELAATVGGYRAGCFAATFDRGYLLIPLHPPEKQIRRCKSYSGRESGHKKGPPMQGPFLR
jgi:hypothetical protein